MRHEAAVTKWNLAEISSQILHWLSDVSSCEAYLGQKLVS